MKACEGLSKVIYRCGENAGDSIRIDIIYEDNHILAAVKPQGILSQSDASGDTDFLTMIKEDIAVRANKPGAAFAGLVHRLDRNTGGTMVFAKTSKGASRLSEQLREKRFYKGYFALTEGELGGGERFLKDRLVKNEMSNTVLKSGGGKLCELYIKPILSNGAYTLVFAAPITGRTHQIRAQLSLLGYPIAGDVKYGGTALKADRNEPELGLWSSIAAVKHPTRDEMCVFISCPPQTGIWKSFKKSVYGGFADYIAGDGFERFTGLKE